MVGKRIISALSIEARGGSVRMKCPWCGLENQLGAKTCVQCGVLLLGDNVNPGPSFRQAPEPRPARPPRIKKERQYGPDHEISRTALKVGLVIVAVVLVLVALTFIHPNIPAGDTQTGTPTMEGSWVASGMPLFLVESNWPNGEMSYLGYENRSVTLVISATDDPTIMSVQMLYSIIDSTINSSAMYGQEPNQKTLQGTVNGTTLTVAQDGLRAEFYLMGSTLFGQWDDTLTYPYFTERVYSGQDGITMYRIRGTGP
jgi:hypothetical protein